MNLLLCLPKCGFQSGYLPAAKGTDVVSGEGEEVTEVPLGATRLVGPEVEQLRKTGQKYYTLIVVNQSHPWVETPVTSTGQ